LPSTSPTPRSTAPVLAEHSELAAEILQKERDRRERLRRRDAEAEPEPRGPGLARGSTSEPPGNDVVESDDVDDEQVAV
jgi:hypothetical protein